MTKLKVYAATVDKIALCYTREYGEPAKRDIASGTAELSTGDTTVADAKEAAADIMLLNGCRVRGLPGGTGA